MAPKLRIEEKGKWSCGVCVRKELGITSSSARQKWVHKQCSGIKGSLCKGKHIICLQELYSEQTGYNYIADVIEEVDIGDGLLLEKVHRFCYLKDGSNAD